MNSILKPQEELAIGRYLERYAESVVGQLEEGVAAFNTVVVIPIYDEPEAQLQHFLEFQKNAHHHHAILMIWVFNAPESSMGSQGLKRTQAVLESMLLKTAANKLSDTLYLAKHSNTQQILFVDRCREKLIPDKQGVGLARKLGMDLALKLVYQQYLSSQVWCHWIYSTDADVRLPANYGLLEPKAKTTACIYPFEHRPESGFEKAMTEYEFSLHYYVQSLKMSGSPYAFHTIGSLLAISSVAYAQVRGIPKRAGAEDFYLLNKLAKLGRVESLTAPLIPISGRPSHRVPFGTGPALIKIQAQHDSNEDFRVYHPRIFRLLAYVLNTASEIASSDTQEDMLLSRLVAKLKNPDENNAVNDILLGLGWQKQAAHIQTLKNSMARQQAFHVWFDAFITLRFIHELRDRLYPNIVLTKLPELLAESLDGEVRRGIDFDFTAWFKTLGISG